MKDTIVLAISKIFYKDNFINYLNENNMTYIDTTTMKETSLKKSKIVNDNYNEVDIIFVDLIKSKLMKLLYNYGIKCCMLCFEPVSTEGDLIEQSFYQNKRHISESEYDEIKKIKHKCISVYDYCAYGAFVGKSIDILDSWNQIKYMHDYYKSENLEKLNYVKKDLSFIDNNSNNYIKPKCPICGEKLIRPIIISGSIDNNIDESGKFEDIKVDINDNNTTWYTKLYLECHKCHAQFDFIEDKEGRVLLDDIFIVDVCAKTRLSY